MASEIRLLLAAAQDAESRGDRPRAIARLQEAAEFYRSRRMERRAAQMERHIDRLEGRTVQVPLDAIADPHLDDLSEDDHAMTYVLDDGALGDDESLQDDGLGFGDELLDAPSRRLQDDFERGPQRADPAIEAWCSFCCKPKTEVGPLVAGPAGAYICAACIGLSGGLLSVDVPVIAVPEPKRVEPQSRSTFLPAQSRAKAEWERRNPRVALVIGPEGAGKSVFLESVGRVAARPFTRGDGSLTVLDLHSPLWADEEGALTRWLDGDESRRVIVAARGALPKPALVLSGASGDESIYDTAALAESVGATISSNVLSRVDGVLAMPAPDRQGLRALATALLNAKGVELPESALESLLEIAQRSGRSAKELAALIARVPAGAYRQ